MVVFVQAHCLSFLGSQLGCPLCHRSKIMTRMATDGESEMHLHYWQSSRLPFDISFFNRSLKCATLYSHTKFHRKKKLYRLDDTERPGGTEGILHKPHSVCRLCFFMITFLKFILILSFLFKFHLLSIFILFVCFIFFIYLSIFFFFPFFYFCLNPVVLAFRIQMK